VPRTGKLRKSFLNLRRSLARVINADEGNQAELQLLQDVAVGVSEAKDLQSAFSAVLSAVCQHTGWSVGRAWLVTKDGREMRCLTVWVGESSPLAAAGAVVLDDDQLFSYVARSQAPWRSADIAHETFAHLRPVAEAGFGAAMLFPVFHQGKFQALIELYRRRSDDADRYLVRTLSSIAALLGALIQRRLSEDHAAYLTQYDPLTDLPNRALFADRLRQEIIQAERHQRLVGVGFLDIDRFKTINDSIGHDVGDALLRSIGQRLRECLRGGDTVARIGGDEFALVLADMAHTDDAARLAHKILTYLRRPFTVREREFYVTGSLGLSFYPHDAIDVDELLRNADVAMYRAKEMGRNTFQFYAAEMMAQAQERLNLDHALRRALERGEFLLHYQPVVELQGGKVVGAEALLRWRHPERGMVPPGKFIPFAEDSGLIVPIGEWVLRSACIQCREWGKAGLGKLRVSVNISPRQFQRPDLFSTIANVLSETKLPADQLELELTEGLLMQNPEAAIANMKRLSDMGVQLSIDDFGTGYSSLSYLKRFPIDRLKIDRSFVSGIPKDSDDIAIATAIIAMAHKLGLNVVAEGVETVDQLSYLRNHDCDVIQGYYFSPPIPNDEYVALIRSSRMLILPPRSDTAGLH
jgi:diguanylate cyclase (GGDEF)-like protein